MLALLLCLCFVSTLGLENKENPRRESQPIQKSEDLDEEAIQFMYQNWEEFKNGGVGHMHTYYNTWKVYIYC